MKANLPVKEKEILKFWDELGLYSRIQEKNAGGEWYLLHDGPPYANGDIHMGTALNKTLKDFVVKYKSMRGYRCPFVPGWDCHGLPIEHRLLRELHKTKHDVEVLDFRRKAKEFALKWLGVQREQFKRLGVLGEWDKPYVTMDPAYEAKEIEGFARLYADGYIYRGLKPVHWCIVCETALAEAELEYHDKESPSIYVRFKADERVNRLFGVENASIVIWTTTPWTLPANLAVAVHPDFQYSAVRVNHGQDAHATSLVLASETLPRLKDELGWEDYEVVATVNGAQLEGMNCDHPLADRKSRVILADFVTLDQGTGCVHTAPGHGQEDYEIAGKYNLEIYSPVDERGRFTPEVRDFAGKQVFEANDLIVQHLRSRGLLLEATKVTHSYPHCWRCKSPVIFRATRQWFINVNHNNLRRRTLELVKQVRWVPAFTEKRFLATVEGRPDWCLSRQRLWGVPIPVFYCTNCHSPFLTPEAADHLVALVRKHGVDIWFEKDVKELVPPGAKCTGCGGGEFEKETAILDVWFDSGTSHQGVLTQRNDQKYPAELYLEGSDQHRGWFQSSMLTAVALTNSPPFREVITTGWTLDEQREKESKSKGNITNPLEIVQKYGADVLRLWVSSVDYSSDMVVGMPIFEQMADAYRKIRNTLRFLLGNLYDFDEEKDAVAREEMPEVDRWALSRAQWLLDEVTRALEDFEFYRAYRRIHTFCTVDLSSFYLDILKDRLYTAGPSSRERRSSQTVFARTLRLLDLMLAPILSFTAEEVWANIRRKNDPQSVHLASWPELDDSARDRDLDERYERLNRVRSEVAKVIERERAQGTIGNSLEAKLVLYCADEELLDFLSSFGRNLQMLFIVSSVEVVNLGQKEPPAEAKATEIEGLFIGIGEAPGRKCSRCWKYSETVGESVHHPEMCGDCVKVLVTYFGEEA
ncbi:MAG: isoleucine--tRNA ligase [bacterium]|nr:isoleucine--tRNA ligase [bacterium]